MVVSLYMCEIPKSVEKVDLDELFKSIDGFIDSRLKPTADGRKIAFVDFKEEHQAYFAKDTLQGFKFSPEDKGLIIKISDNSKGGRSQMPNRRGGDHYLNSKRDRDTYNRNYKSSRSNSIDKNERHDRNDRYDRNERYERNEINDRNRSHIKNNNNFSSNEPVANNNLVDLVSLLNTQANTTNKPYVINDQNPSEQQPNILSNLLETIQNLQTVQLLSTLSNQNADTDKQKESRGTDRNSQFIKSLTKFDEFFDNVMYKKNATNIVYVEGVPNDTSEREIAHIFRPFPGFKSVRLINREKGGVKSILCFADFENIHQSTICINTLQGYRFDKNDLLGLHFSYGVSKNKERR